MPTAVKDELALFADTWGARGVRAWHEGWWEMAQETADLLAPIIGVPKGTLTMHQNVTVAQSVIASCFDFQGPRNRIVLQDLDFPSNHYLFEGFRKYGAEIVYVKSDDSVRAPIERLIDAIDERTLLVPISYVLFRSAAIQDVRPVIEKAHAVGARVILDLYQAAGTIPLDVSGLGADFAVGGSVKWLCGGPGAGYMYVREDLIREMVPAMSGWAGHAAPFAFATGPSDRAGGIERFQSGTPNVPVYYMARAGYRIVNDVGVPAIREKSLRLTRIMMEAARERGWRLNTPERDDERGGSVVIDVPDGERIANALIAAGVIVDYRPSAGIRMAPHFYNSEAEVRDAMLRLAELAAT
ncbi:MAG: aminotransferase class V-fold PLP-dependent enzyme [Acidobacteria bacterium]|nr:aminotransferase class V-fold PLP-dependent enzyme [Acidobacteriota bacterium]